MNRLLKPVDRACEWAAGLLVTALLLDVALGVVTRAWNDPVAWTDELARLLMVWLAMAGWILSTRRRGHVRIRYFQNLLPEPLWRLLEVVIQAGLMVLGGLAAWFGVDLVGRNIDLEATSLPISMAWMYVPLVPAGLVTIVQAGIDMALQLRPGLAPVAAPVADPAP